MDFNKLSLLKKLTIPFSVFITGACVLIIEVTAIRILAPYFGNTIFAISSVISVVLLALSLGYYFGGTLADKYPDEKLFYKIIVVSGIAVIFLHLFGILFLTVFGYKLSITQGPIVSSVILFFLQNLLLGMLSPFAIKLQKIRLDQMGVGSVSGRIYFWSTIGSIAGSLLAGFILIPHFGIDKIILGVGCLLIILGLAGWLKNSRWLRFILIAFLVIVFLFFNYFINFAHTFYLKTGVYIYDSLYQKIVIYEGIFNGEKTRFLEQDKNLSAAEFINSDNLVYDYTKYYALYKIFKPGSKEILAIGGGAYSIPKAVLRDSPKINVDVAEIDPLIFTLGKQYFEVPTSPKLNNFVEDGRRFLYDSNKKYDVIFGDAYASFVSIPEHFTTQEFFTKVKEKLNDDGVFIGNIIGNLSPKPESFALSEIKTFKSVFNNSYFFAVESPDSKKLQNIIFVGYNSNKIIGFNNLFIKKNKNPIISGLSQKQINLDSLNLFTYPILTDDFSPVDYLMSKEFVGLQ